MTPPWPGNRPPESLAPARRFKRLANRSPRIESRATSSEASAHMSVENLKLNISGTAVPTSTPVTSAATTPHAAPSIVLPRTHERREFASAPTPATEVGPGIGDPHNGEQPNDQPLTTNILEPCEREPGGCKPEGGGEIAPQRGKQLRAAWKTHHQENRKQPGEAWPPQTQPRAAVCQRGPCKRCAR